MNMDIAQKRLISHAENEEYRLRQAIAAFRMWSVAAATNRGETLTRL
jgi:hypothetical protein